MTLTNLSDPLLSCCYKGSTSWYPHGILVTCHFDRWRGKKKAEEETAKHTYAIFSLGDRQGTSSSISSSDSSPSWSKDSWPGRCKVELVNISGTGKILGLLLPETLQAKLVTRRRRRRRRRKKRRRRGKRRSAWKYFTHAAKVCQLHEYVAFNEIMSRGSCPLNSARGDL